MVQGVGRVSQPGENRAPSVEVGLRVSRGVDHRDSSLASSNPERASEPCLFVRLVGNFFSWIRKKLSGLCNACATCFCGAGGSSADTQKNETEEDPRSESSIESASHRDPNAASSGEKIDPAPSVSERETHEDPTSESSVESASHRDPTAASSGEKTDRTPKSAPETETHEDPTSSSSSDVSTSESEEDSDSDPAPEPQAPPLVGGDVSISGLLGLLGDKTAPVVGKKPPLSQKEALKGASRRLKELFEEGTADGSEDLERRKRELVGLIDNRKGLALVGRLPAENSLREVVALFDDFVQVLGNGPTVLDSALLSDDLTMSMFVSSLDKVCAASDRQVNFKRELTKSFVAWLECFGSPAYRFILEKKIEEIAMILEAMIQQIENIGPAVGDSLNDPLFAHRSTDCGGAAEEERKALRKQAILDHLRKISIEGGADSLRQRVSLIQQSLQVLNANVRRGDTMASMLPLDDRGNSTRELKLGEINAILGQIGALFGLDEDTSPYIYIEGINDREHEFRSSRG